MTQTYTTFVCKKKKKKKKDGDGGGGGGGGGGDKKFPKKIKSYPEMVSEPKERKKKDVLRGGVINNAVSSECRGEQWHCVEKR